VCSLNPLETAIDADFLIDCMAERAPKRFEVKDEPRSGSPPSAARLRRVLEFETLGRIIAFRQSMRH
jgi:hypothetical protein